MHLPTASSAAGLLDFAVPLAAAHGAALVGVHVLPAVVVYADATVSMSTEFIVAQQDAFAEEARAAERAFQAKLAGSGLDFEWRRAEAGDEPTMRTAASLANTADLVIATQYHDGIPAAAGYSPDELALRTGRPVLIVPRSGAWAPVGRRVLVAWNGSREASRAAFDCLALIAPDAELRLLSVDSPRGAGTMAAMARALARHGPQPTPVLISRSEGRSVTEEILRYAREFGADLLVLGCYGHSRLRETVFGGATTRILRHMSLPLLMAH